MSKNRQSDPERQIVVRSLALSLPNQFEIATHSHAWPQLVYAVGGVMSVETAKGTWVVPSHRAVWIPPGFEHAVRVTGVVRMRTLYFLPRFVNRFLRDRVIQDGSFENCAAISVSPLLRELIWETFRVGMLTLDVPRHVTLAQMILDQVERTDAAPFEVKIPVDIRAQRVAREARANLASARSIAELVRGCGASTRTIERIFLNETGVTFGKWLRRTKALHALERIAAGDSVTAAALAVGYESTSAFIAMFRQCFGTTPGKYFSSAASTRRSLRP